MTTSAKDRPRLQFGDFELDPAGPELRRRGRVVALRPKSLALIGYLALRPGQLVRKEDLIDAVWGDTVVSDATLARTVFDAREALGDDSRKPRFIETVHRLGFRFLVDSAPAAPPVVPGASPGAGPIGRRRERQQLAGLRTLAEAGSRQMVFLAGEAGIGKTTILERFLAESRFPGPATGERDLRAGSLSEGAGPVLVGRGQCIEHHGTAEAYLPFLDALGELCRSTEGEAVVAVLRRVAPTWLAQFPWLIADADRAALERELRGVSSDRMMRELAEALEILAQGRLLILALEDLHWCDSATADLLSFLSRRQGPARLMMVATYRPVDAILADNPIRRVHQELVRQNRCHGITVESLAPVDVGDLIVQRFDAAAFARDLAVVVHRRTEGNPLFVVSMLDDLVSQGRISSVDGAWRLGGRLDDIEKSVPEDLLQMVVAMVDRLDDEERAVVEAGSVVGGAFSAAAAAAALGRDTVEIEDRCEAMARRGVLLDHSGTATWPDGTSASAYVFRHALYADALYKRIPAARRRRLHQRVGTALETGFAADLAAAAGVLGMHFDNAGDPTRAARYLRQAGEVAARRGAPREAVALFARVRAHLEALPEGAERTFEELMVEIAAGPALSAIEGYSSMEVERIFQRARERCRALGDGPQLFPVLWGLWAFWCVRGRNNEALELAKQGFDVAERSGDPEMILEAHHMMWVTHFFRGNIGEAGRHLDAGLVLYDRSFHHSHVMLFGQDPAVVGLAYRSLVWLAQGRVREAAEQSVMAMELGRSLGHPVSLIFGVGFAAWMHEERGDAERCRELIREVVGIASSQGLSFWHAHGNWMTARTLATVDPDAGIAGMRASIEQLRAMGARMGVAGYLVTLARVHMQAGDNDAGRRLLDEAWAIGEQTGEWLGRAELLRLRGDLELAADRCDTARAEGLYRDAVDLARLQEATATELRSAISLVRLLEKVGRDREAAALLAPIVERLPADEESPDLVEARSWAQD